MLHDTLTTQRKIQILTTVQRHGCLSRTRAAMYGRMSVRDGILVVDELVQKGLLIEEENRGAGRGLKVSLSDKGLKVLREVGALKAMLEGF